MIEINIEKQPDINVIMEKQGPAGKDVELRVNETHIQWHYTTEETWNNLIAIADLIGPSGINGVDGVNGADGKQIELRVDSGYIQWRYVNETWINLISLAELINEQDPVFVNSEAYNFESGDKNILDKLNNFPEISGEPTGFTNPSEVIFNYDSTTRKVKLTGNVEAYYKGIKVEELINGWESDAHADAPGTYFLYYCDGSFKFNTSAWNFNCLQIAFVQYSINNNGHHICIRESHGFMPWQVHSHLHETFGTYLQSGGDLSNYILSNINNRRPYVSTTILMDEDLKSTVNALLSNSYTHRYLIGDGTARQFTTDNTDIVKLTNGIPQINYWNGNEWTFVDMENNRYCALFLVALPVAEDLESQKFRYMWIQPQTQSSSLSVIQGLSLLDLTVGDSSLFASEFCFIAKIIIRRLGDNWTIHQVDKLTGSKKIQVGSQAGNYLSIVSTDNTLSGNGTSTNPLSVIDINNQVLSIESSATPEINTDNYNFVSITALATDITSMTSGLTGTPDNFDKLIFRIKDDGTIRNIIWGDSFEAKGAALPIATTAGKVLTVGFIYDSLTSKWGCVASLTEE